MRYNKILISGEVTDNLGRDFEGVTVEAKFANIVKITKTDQSGNYFLELPLNTSYNSNQVKIEAKFNELCKKSELVELNRTNQIYRDIKLSCDELKTGIPEKNNSNIFEDDEYIFTLIECKRLALSIQVKLNVVSKNLDRTITLLGSGYRENGTRVFDNFNHEYWVQTIKIGNNSKSTDPISQLLIQNITTDVVLIFTNVASNSNKIPLLEIAMFHDRKVHFRNIPIK